MCNSYFMADVSEICTNCCLPMWLFDVVKIVENRILTGLSRNSVVSVRLTTVNTW